MKLGLQVALIILASPHMALVLGLACDSDCAACWLDGDTHGTDIKFTCREGHCGSKCPAGYNGIHCAKTERC